MQDNLKINMAEQEIDLSKKHALIDLDGLVSPAILASIIGCNVSLVYQEVQQGRLPAVLIESTYRECLHMYIRHFKKNQDLKIERERNAHNLAVAKLEEASKLKMAKAEASGGTSRRFGSDENEDGSSMPPLMAAKYKQDIRLNIARETQLWIKASIERGEYISSEVLADLCEPILGTMRETLVALSRTSPEAEKAVDLVMENLYSLGVTLTEQAQRDSERFIDAILKKEIDYTSIEIEDAPEPIL